MPIKPNPARGKYELHAQPEDMERWATAATRLDMSLAAWIRSRCNAAERAETRAFESAIARERKKRGDE